MNGSETVETLALLDSGAGGIFMDQNFAKTHGFKLIPLVEPLTVFNVDGTPNKRGTITHYTKTEVTINGRTTLVDFYISGLGKQRVILGFPWLQTHNPDIDWCAGTLKWKLDRADAHQRLINAIKLHRQRITQQRKRQRPTIAEEQDPDEILNHTQNPISPDSPDNEAIVVSMDEEEDLSLVLSFINGHPEDDIWINSKTSHSQTFAQKYEKREEKPLEEMVPPEFHEYLDVFSEQAATRFPASRPWDHAIELKPTFEPKSSKIYPMTPEEDELAKQFVKENLDKGYIRPSTSPMASSFFFVGKKDGKKRPCQDYQYLNEHTVKNAYPLPLVSDLMDKLKDAKYFTKLDVRWGYNNIRIKDGDQWKAAFKTKYGLFEPTVRFFGLCKSPATF